MNQGVDKRLIEHAVGINASIKEVWSIFTDPELTKQMGGYYETDWRVGSSFGFKNLNGTKVTNGVLLEFKNERLLKHSLFELGSQKLMAIITYEFEEKDGYVLLKGREELTKALDSKGYKEAFEGWSFTLNMVKGIAERSLK